MIYKCKTCSHEIIKNDPPDLLNIFDECECCSGKNFWIDLSTYSDLASGCYRLKKLDESLIEEEREKLEKLESHNHLLSSMVNDLEEENSQLQKDKKITIDLQTNKKILRNKVDNLTKKVRLLKKMLYTSISILVALLLYIMSVLG